MPTDVLADTYGYKLLLSDIFGYRSLKINKKQILYQSFQVETLLKFKKTYRHCIQVNFQNKIGECGRDSINGDMEPNLSKALTLF